MAFAARFNLHNNKPPVRVYLHEVGLKEAYGFYAASKANSYLTEILQDDDFRERVADFDWLLVAMWGDGTDRVIDFFGFSGIREWPGNPDISNWVLRNGVYVPQTEINIKNTATCEDTIIMFGQEGEYRRKCGSLEEYIQNPPEIHPLMKAVIQTEPFHDV